MPERVDLRRYFKFLNSIRNRGDSSSIRGCCKGIYTYGNAFKLVQKWERWGVINTYKETRDRLTKLTELGERYYQSIKFQLGVENGN